MEITKKQESAKKLFGKAFMSTRQWLSGQGQLADVEIEDNREKPHREFMELTFFVKRGVFSEKQKEMIRYFLLKDLTPTLIELQICGWSKIRIKVCSRRHKTTEYCWAIEKRT